MKIQKIQVASEVQEHGLPKPTRNYIPDWYKKTSLYEDGSNNVLKQDGFRNTFKRCVPFLDALTVGYTYELWCDLLVKKNGTVTKIEFRVERPPVEMRTISASLELPVPAGHSINRWAWKIPYFTQTPKGYSSLIVQPLNRFDLPFTTLSGVVDTDEVMYAGNVPFFLKEGFEGVIEKGTPIFQLIPFKRENWVIEQNDELIQKGRINEKESLSHLFGWYKRKVWQKKEYN